MNTLPDGRVTDFGDAHEVKGLDTSPLIALYWDELLNSTLNPAKAPPVDPCMLWKYPKTRKEKNGKKNKEKEERRSVKIGGGGGKENKLFFTLVLPLCFNEYSYSNFFFFFF